MTNLFDLILLGDPASGKATQGAKLIRKYKLVNIDMGKELRAIAEKNTNRKLSFVFKKTIQSGKLTPTALVRRILRKKITTASKRKGLLFNGTPKMLGEAKLVAKLLQQRSRPLVIFLRIPQKEIIKRISSRREYFRGKYSKRQDDNTRALKNRIKYYHSNISSVIDFFKKKYPYTAISGIGTREEVFKRIDQFIQSANARFN